MTYRQVVLRYRGVVSQQWNHTVRLQATMLSMVSEKAIDERELHPYLRPSTGRRQKLTKKEAKQTSDRLREIMKARKQRGG